MRPPSLHSNFFSSLKQVEKRLKLESPSQPSTLSPDSLPPPSPPPAQPPLLGETNYTPIESLSSPLYLNIDQPNSSNTENSSSSSSLESSEPPREFFSNSLDFPQTQENPPPPDTVQDPQTISRAELSEVDDIELLIQLLGLSDCEEKEERKQENRFALGLKNGGGNCGHECRFYSKVVGVKGPKCEKEVERLEGWIKHFRNDGGDQGRREPLRLAHLLLAKSAFLSQGGNDDGFGKIELPTTVEEFFHNDPPKE